MRPAARFQRTRSPAEGIAITRSSCGGVVENGSRERTRFANYRKRRPMKNSRAQYGLLLASVVVAVVAYPRLPSRVPIHYDYSGHANGFVDKPLGAFALPLGLVVLHMVLLSLRAYTVDASAPGGVLSAWNITHAGVLSAGFVIFGLPYAHALDLSIRLGPCLLFAVAILCMSVGTASYSIEPNVWLGTGIASTPDWPICSG